MNDSNLYGLVLIGGVSQRMGKDKKDIFFHELPQWKFAFQLLSRFCNKVFLSVRKINDAIPIAIPQIKDKFLIQSPLNGIKSAFDVNDKVAWLVLACDMPNVNAECIEDIIKERDKSCLATCFWNEKRKHLEPLISIWEPRCANELKIFQGKSPLKFLSSKSVNLIYPENPNWLDNINTPEELKQWKSKP